MALGLGDALAGQRAARAGDRRPARRRGHVCSRRPDPERRATGRTGADRRAGDPEGGRTASRSPGGPGRPAQRREVDPVQPAGRRRAVGHPRRARHHPGRGGHRGGDPRGNSLLRGHRRHAAQVPDRAGHRVLLGAPGPRGAGPGRHRPAGHRRHRRGDPSGPTAGRADRRRRAARPSSCSTSGSWSPPRTAPDILVDIGDRLAFLGEAPVLKVSALTGFGVHHILPAVAAAEEAYHSRIPTGELNRAIKSIQAGPPAGRGQDPVRGAGSQRPAHVHPVHQRPAAAAPTSAMWNGGCASGSNSVRRRSSCGSGPRVRDGGGGRRRAVTARRVSTGLGRTDGTDWPDRRRRGEPCPGVSSATSAWKTEELTEDGICPDCGTEPLEHRKSPGTSSSCWWPASSTWATGPSRASPGWSTTSDRGDRPGAGQPTT